MSQSELSTVLVVDDEVPILDALADLLEDDFLVLTASNAAEGLKLLGEHDVSVVLSDQRMPTMKGEEFLARVAERSIATRVLLTGYTDFEDLVQAVNRGHIYSFVSKPWSSVQLRSLVTRAVERFELERRLLQEKALLNLLMEHTPDLISIKDLEGRYLRLNRAYARALGNDDPEELIGSTDRELGRSLFDPRGQTAGKPEVREEIDVTVQANDSRRWYSTTRVVTPESSANEPLVVEISRDITERLETSFRLEEHAGRLEALNEELSRVSFIVAHHLQEPLRQIASFVSLLSRRELLKDGASEYIGYVREGVARAKSVMRDFSTYLDLFQPILKENASLARSALLARDLVLVSHPEIEVVIKGDAFVEGHSELLTRLIHSLLENSAIHGRSAHPVVVTITSEEGAALLCVEDRGPGIPEEDRERVLELFETNVSGVRTGLGLALCQRIAKQHDGKLWLESGLTEGLRVCVKLAVESYNVLAQDSSKSRDEIADGSPPGIERLEELEARLGQAKLFAATAAHDLNEPLRVISGYLNLLERREGAALTSEGREFLDFALKSSGRMRALIDNLLVYSVSGKSPKGELRKLDEVVGEVQSDLRSAIDESGGTIHAEPSLGTVVIWDVEGRQLLLNLLSNSLKYRSKRTPEIRVRVENRDNKCIVVVEDNGLGIPDESRSSIFEPFVRGDHEELQKGSGLGLATCARIVQGWGGQIWYEPGDGGGSRFLFTLPKL